MSKHRVLETHFKSTKNARSIAQTAIYRKKEKKSANISTKTTLLFLRKIR
jgi:hypothetical protein